MGDTAMLSPWVCPYIGGYPAWIQLSFTQHHHVNRTYAVLRHHNHHYTLLVVARKLQLQLSSLFLSSLLAVSPLLAAAASRTPHSTRSSRNRLPSCSTTT